MVWHVRHVLRVVMTLLGVLAVVTATSPADAAGTLTPVRSMPWPTVGTLGDPDVNINGLTVLGDRLYALNNYSGGGRVHTLDPATGALLGSFPPTTAYIPGHDLASDARHLYVLELAPVEGRIHKVDPATGAELAVITPSGITITGGSGGLTYSGGMLHLVVATVECAGVSIIHLDPASGQVTGCFNVNQFGIDPRELTSVDAGLLYGSSDGGSFVVRTLSASGVVLDATTLVTSVPIDVRGLACGDQELFASNRTSATIDVYAFTSCVEPIPYGFEGFHQPVDNLPLVNVANAGRTVPVKWRITDNHGGGVDDPASFVSVTSAVTDCSDSITSVDLETYAGGSGLLSQGDGRWQFNWAVPATYAGSCRTLYLNLADTVGWTAEQLRAAGRAADCRFR